MRPLDKLNMEQDHTSPTMVWSAITKKMETALHPSMAAVLRCQLSPATAHVVESVDSAAKSHAMHAAKASVAGPAVAPWKTWAKRTSCSIVAASNATTSRQVV